MAISLNDIKRGQELKPPKLTVFGVPGVGKTTFAAGAPKPIFLMSEDGLGTLDVDRFPMLTDFQGAIDALTVLYKEKHQYQTVVLDSLDFLEPLIWAHVCESHGQKEIEDFGYGKGYVYALDAWRRLLKAFNCLRDQRGMAIVLIAHSDIKRFDSPIADPYDRFVMRLHTKAAALVNDWSDALLFANYHVATKTTDTGFNKKVRRGVTTGERILYTQETPGYTAKNRFGLPEQIPMTWADFQTALTQNVPTTQDKEAVNG